MYISYKFLNIYEEMIKESVMYLKTIDILSFIYYFLIKHPLFKNNEQQDSQEFFRVFSEDINYELNKAKRNYIYEL